MALSRKQKHKLITHLADLYPDGGRSRQVVVQAGLNPGLIKYDQAEDTRWHEIIAEAENQNALIQLLEHVLVEYSRNPFLHEIHALLIADYGDKLDLLAKAIQLGQCILFLGPGVLLRRDPFGKLVPFKQAFAHELAHELRNKRVFYDEKELDNLNYIAQRYVEMPKYISGEQGKKAVEFYKNSSNRIEQTVFDLLAQFNFPFIINTNPDDNLAIAIRRRGKNTCTVRYYSTANNPTSRLEQQQSQTCTEQLLYNVLGSFDEAHSILTTESQLLNFTTRVLKADPPLDSSVLGAFDDHKYYLFLGFDFSQWYMKIMFDTVLKLVKKNDRSFSIHANGNHPSTDLSSIELFEEEFKFYFINEDIETFLRQLLNIYLED